MTQNKFLPYFTLGRVAESLFKWKKTDALIKDRQGNIFFAMKHIEAPDGWSQLAIEIAASKYFRRAGIKTAENSIKTLVQRVVNAIVKSGLQQGYFQNLHEANVFKEELKFILYSQRAAFNSPVWFNVGLFESYKLNSESPHFAYNFIERKITQIKNAYARPQCSACFIQKVDDSLEGIFDLAKTEAKLFKYGSGTGTNFSSLRSKYEELSTGGLSSGLISFLEVLDRGAGAIKSGGTTRRAAKMVVLNLDHPEVLEFIDWKMNEEKKAQALIAAGYSSDIDGEAYKTVAGQNANNSVRITDQFMKGLGKNKDWILRSRTSHKILNKIPSKKLWQKISEAAWVCADPGLQFHDTINKWHTCKKSGVINASNPCSEFMFLDDSACNLASINLVHYMKQEGGWDLAALRHTVKILITAQDILVDYSSYPTAEIAKNSHAFRPLGLGFANLGSELMRLALPYDSDQARAMASFVASFIHVNAYLTSAELAEKLGSFAGYSKNKMEMLKVIQQHQKFVQKKYFTNIENESYLQLKQDWQNLLTKKKFRNSQVTAIAPTGTIGLLMDCDTTGVEPDYALVKYKKLVGGGELKMINQAIQPALLRLKYTDKQVVEILDYIIQNNSVVGAPHLDMDHYSIFDCAVSDRTDRVLSPESHLKMMAAIQPFVSGAISKTVNLPSYSTQEDVEKIYYQAWQLGLKSVAIYRDGSKKAQPLNKKDLALKCPDCGNDTELRGGCYRCVNCGTTIGCGA